MELRGKVCLVTGATSGIGALTALAFAKRGDHVAIAARNPQRDSLENLKATAAEHDVGACFIQAEMGTAEGCARTVAEAKALVGGTLTF